MVGDPKGAGAVLLIGESSWGPDKELSIKFAELDRNGHIGRPGEVPVRTLPQMFNFAVATGAVDLVTGKVASAIKGPGCDPRWLFHEMVADEEQSDIVIGEYPSHGGEPSMRVRMARQER